MKRVNINGFSSSSPWRYHEFCTDALICLKELDEYTPRLSNIQGNLGEFTRNSYLLEYMETVFHDLRKESINLIRLCNLLDLHPKGLAYIQAAVQIKNNVDNVLEELELYTNNFSRDKKSFSSWLSMALKRILLMLQELLTDLKEVILQIQNTLIYHN